MVDAKEALTKRLAFKFDSENKKKEESAIEHSSSWTAAGYEKAANWGC
jgi:hypothetical protein